MSREPGADPGIEQLLNRMARDGWRLHGSTGGFFIFERLKR